MNVNSPEFIDKKEKLKSLMKKLKGKENEEELKRVKEEFKELISQVNPLLIAFAENELVNEGFSREDLMTACDIHLLLFKDKIENPDLKVPDDHPIKKFQEDHKIILRIMEDLIEKIKELRRFGDFKSGEEILFEIEKLLQKLMEAENHNVRQENTLFPILERHGVEQPPAIMWAEHTEMKEQKKEMIKMLKKKDSYEFKDFCNKIHEMATFLLEKFSLHTQKEQNILYVTALDIITPEEWKDIEEECDNLGYFYEN
ncbi:MAG: DUF438 domain-containing protein [Brevinematales bacterium]|nr:DUF438 domain-containing protein [Brevinematales bacterium]